MKENGKIIKCMDLVLVNKKMETITKVNGLII